MRPIEDLAIHISFSPFSWSFGYDVRVAALDINIGPLFISFVWPNCPYWRWEDLPNSDINRRKQK